MGVRLCWVGGVEVVVGGGEKVCGCDAVVDGGGCDAVVDGGVSLWCVGVRLWWVGV